MAAEGVLLALQAAAGALTQCEVPFLLVGDAEMPAWGGVRATADADFLLATGSSGESRQDILLRVVSALRDTGFAHLEGPDRKRLGDHLILHFWFPLRPQGISIRADLLVADARFYEEVVARGVERKVNGFIVPLASCEDLVLLKLEAGRPIDIADAQAQCAIHRRDLDAEYLHRRAAELGLEDKLRAVLAAPP